MSFQTLLLNQMSDFRDSEDHHRLEVVEMCTILKQKQKSIYSKIRHSIQCSDRNLDQSFNQKPLDSLESVAICFQKHAQKINTNSSSHKKHVCTSETRPPAQT